MEMELWATEYQLLNSTPEYVFEWLKSNVVERHGLGDDDRDDLESSLFKRNNKLINLGLALFGEVPSVGYELFKSGDPIIRRAALAGRSVRPVFLDDSWVMRDDVLPVLLQDEIQLKKLESSGEERTFLHELLGNKFLPSKVLESVYEKDGVFSAVDDELWIDLVAMTARNDRLKTPYKSTWMDGYDEYMYNSVFVEAWRLAVALPVNKRAAVVLSYLMEWLVPERPHDMNVMDAIERWRSDDEKEDERYAYVRTALVRIIGDYTEEFKSLKDHSDLSLRKGYYSNLKSPKVDDVKSGLERDGCEFLEAAIYNEAFYANEETRHALSRACWDAPDEHSRMDYPNYFKVQEERLSAKYPGWFKDDWSGELPFEAIDDPEERRERRLEHLNAQVAELHKTLLGTKDEYQEANEFGEDSVLNDLRMELRSIGEHLGKLYQKSSFSWGWLAAGSALGFMVGKF